jgi:hypothetical protein
MRPMSDMQTSLRVWLTYISRLPSSNPPYPFAPPSMLQVETAQYKDRMSPCLLEGWIQTSL